MEDHRLSGIRNSLMVFWRQSPQKLKLSFVFRESC